MLASNRLAERIVSLTRSRRRGRAMASAGRFEEFLSYLDLHAADLRQLQCQNLRELLRTGEARPGRTSVPERAAWYRYLQRQGHVFTEEELRAREAVLCAPARAQRLAAQPALQQQLDRSLALLERRFEEFAAWRKPCLKAIFDVAASNSDADEVWQNFHEPVLSQAAAAAERYVTGVGGHAL